MLRILLSAYYLGRIAYINAHPLRIERASTQYDALLLSIITGQEEGWARIGFVDSGGGRIYTAKRYIGLQVGWGGA